MAVQAQDAAPTVDASSMDELNRCLNEAGDNPRGCIGKISNECQQTAEGSTTPGIVACVQKETALWDRILNDRYKALMASTRERQEDAPGWGQDADAVGKLRDAQRKWVAFRDAECERIFAYYVAGTIRGPVAASCQLSLTAERAIDLAPRKH